MVLTISWRPLTGFVDGFSILIPIPDVAGISLSPFPTSSVTIFHRLTKPAFDTITVIGQFPRTYTRIRTMCWQPRKADGIFVIGAPHVAT